MWRPWLLLALLVGCAPGTHEGACLWRVDSVDYDEVVDIAYGCAEVDVAYCDDPGRDILLTDTPFATEWAPDETCEELGYVNDCESSWAADDCQFSEPGDAVAPAPIPTQ